MGRLTGLRRNGCMEAHTLSRSFLVRRLKQIALRLVKSSAVRQLGYDPQTRMVAVQFESSDSIYGYPNVSDEELAGLLNVLRNQGSIGEYITTVLKAHHEHEHVRSDEPDEDEH
jgi:hypothetical protein